MGEEIDCILHTVMHHSSTSTYNQISLKSRKLFVDGWSGGRMDGHLTPALLIRLCQRVDLKMETRHPVEGSFGSEFLTIDNHCGVMAV